MYYKKYRFSKNKIIESNVVYENEDTFNLSSNNLTSTDVDRSIIKLTHQMKENFISAKQDFDNYLKTNLVGKIKSNSQDSITAKESQINELLKDSNDKAHNTYNDNYDNEQNETLPEQNNKLESLKHEIESIPEEQDHNSLSSILTDIDDTSQKNNHIHLTGSPSSSFSSSSEDSSSSSSTNDSFMANDFSSIETDELSSLDKINKKVKRKKKELKKNTKRHISENNSKLTSDKVCYQALQMIKFLGTLHMRKLDLKHEPRLRRIAFLEWISQLEIAFSSNKYTTKVLQDYSTKNKIHQTKSKLVDSLVYTVAYAFMDKATRTSTIAYKNQGSKLLKVLHMKCASVDENTKLRARMQFLSCKMTFEETAINFLTRLEQKANEARNYDIKI